MLSIEAAQYFVPEKFIDLNEVPELYGLSKNELKVFTRLYGLEKIPSAQDMSLHDLVSIPIKKLLYDNQIDQKDIRIVIYAHTSKVVTPFMQSIVKFIKDEFHFENAIIFGTSINNCASTISALEMASNMLKLMDSSTKALIITGELTFTQIQKVIPKISILGDAAAVMLVGQEQAHNRLLAVDVEIDGASADGIWMTPEQNKQYEHDYAPTFSRVIKSALSKAGIDLSDVKFIFPHNVNIPSWNNVVSHLDIPISKVYLDNIKRYSHCFGADIVINLCDATRDGLIKSGDYYVMATVGLGSIYAAAVFQH